MFPNLSGKGKWSTFLTPKILTSFSSHLVERKKIDENYVKLLLQEIAERPCHAEPILLDSPGRPKICFGAKKPSIAAYAGVRFCYILPPALRRGQHVAMPVCQQLLPESKLKKMKLSSKPSLQLSRENQVLTSVSMPTPH